VIEALKTSLLETENSDVSSHNNRSLTSPPRMRRLVDLQGDVTESRGEDGIILNEYRANAELPPLHWAAQQAVQQQPQPWFRNSQQVSAMISNFSTSYNVVNISLVLPILRTILRGESNASSTNATATGTATGTASSSIDEDAVAAVASSLLAGMILGQIMGGALGDVLGAKVALRGVMMLQVLASLGSMTGTASSTSPSSIFWYLAGWRFILGVGAGGVYPLAAVLSATQEQEQGEEANDQRLVSPIADGVTREPSEATDTQNSDGLVADAINHPSSLHRVVLTFSMQGLGFIAVPLVTVPLLYTVKDLNIIWRVILGLGSIPGMLLLLWQSKNSSCRVGRSSRRHEMVPTDETSAAPESPTGVAAFEGNTNGGTELRDVVEVQQHSNVTFDSLPSLEKQSLGSGENGSNGDIGLVPSEEHRGWWDSVKNEEQLIPKLLGTAATWFLFDVLFYGNTLFQPIVIEAAFGAREDGNPLRSLQRTAVNSLALTSIALPGYAVAGLLLGKKTRWCYCGVEQTPRFVMLQGFTAMAVLYLAIGTCWNDLRRYPPLLVFLYSLTFFFANYGPNTTTFVIPSLVYSPACRSTFNGLSAAAGKLGALAGASLFEPAAHRYGDATVMLICAGIAGVSLTITKLFVPQTLGDQTEHIAHHRYRNVESQSTGATTGTIV
jgi:MFS transporter, PHS family, inorganic phosphate transporter